MEKVDLFALIDELQQEIEESRNGLFSKNKTIDTRIVMEIIDDIRKAAKNEFDSSRNIIKERDTIIANANAQAEAIIRSATDRANNMISENSVARAAYEKSVKMVEQSRAKSMQIRQSAMDYATDVLDELESYFTEYLGYVRDNKSRMAGKSTAEAGQTTDSSVEQ